MVCRHPGRRALSNPGVRCTKLRWRLFRMAKLTAASIAQLPLATCRFRSLLRNLS